MSKGVKKVASVATAVAIPFAAPAVASAIGLSSAIGSVAGSALTGAALGAARGAVFGENVGRSALLGAVGGGIGGYAGLGFGPSGTYAPVTNYSIDGAGAFAPVTDYNFVAGMDTYAPMADYSIATGADMYAPVVDRSFVSTAPTAGLTPYWTPYTGMLMQSPGLMSSLGLSTPGLFRAAGQLIGAKVAGDGLSSQERELLNAQVGELQKLQQANQELFNQRVEAAKTLLKEASYFDPEYFGLQSANRAQIAGARAKRAGLRGLEGEARQAEARRYDIATALNTGTAFDTGYGLGVQGRLQTTVAGLNALPTWYPSSISDYSGLRSAYNDAALRARQRQMDIGSLFGSLTGYNEVQNPMIR